RGRLLRPPQPSAGAARPGAGSALALVDLHDGVEHLERLGARPLERVAADDGPGAAAVADRARHLEDAFGIARRTAGEHYQTAPVEAGLHDVGATGRLRRDVDAFLLVDLLGFRLFDGVGRRPDLGAVRAAQ